MNIKIKTLRHLELFSGIGGFRRAIDLISKDLKIQSKCIGFSEIDKYAVESYLANYNTEDEIQLGDIEKFTSSEDNIRKLEDFDLLTGGFPCQPFSMMGNQKGFDDRRGNVFYSILNILKIKKPKYILLENVKNLYTHNKRKTYQEIKRALENDGGYKIYDDIFNTSNFGLPQHRRRIFIFGVRQEILQKENLKIRFSEELIKESFCNIKKPMSLRIYKNILDGILDFENIEEKYYLSERIKPTILSNGSKNFKSNSEINQLIARPLTATMVKMHRACQDNYYSDEFLKANCPHSYLENKFPKEEEIKHKIRKLTPWEALKLQGFEKDFYYNASKKNVSNYQLYKQAGNAVSVNTVYAILNYLIEKKYISFK